MLGQGQEQCWSGDWGRNTAGFPSNKESVSNMDARMSSGSWVPGRGPGRAAERWMWTGFEVTSAEVGLRHRGWVRGLWVPGPN